MLEFKTISRVARVLLDMNQSELGEALGLNLEAVSCWERGINTPSPRHRRAFEVLCQKHGVGFMDNGMPVVIDNHMRVVSVYDRQVDGVPTGRSSPVGCREVA